MGIKDIVKRIFAKNKKVVICGLDNAGKSTLVSFLQNGTFIEHAPTLGKEQTTLEVQGVRMDLIDLGGQKDFRSLWLGEMKDAECVLFMIDAHDVERFKEAKTELWKLSSIFETKPLIILANKYDLEPVATVKEIINALELDKISSFQILPISCKTGYGIVNAFSKIYYKLTGKQLSKKVSPMALTVFDKGGVPLTSTSKDDILKGGLFAALTTFVKESFNSELNQLKIGEHVILVKRSKHLMGSIILKEGDHIDIKEAEVGLNELLSHLEHMCPELEEQKLDTSKIEYLVKQYSTNLL
ncbi:MAG: ADP-ribosylation factor-like protein [Promethearchaeota archaeon]